ncbi:MAG: 1-deoxy-D-xylulose-5-phosphate synthase [Spirochaetales bacterium]|nr:1-deoxy-D-xylulose-5-phosphate synthase [Spirochaetales bacterium]
MDKSFLETVNLPEDLKTLSIKDLKKLSGEIRNRIIEVVSANGGHLASNLGVVELTVALHRVFKSPVDKIIWDVGHQCYAHKILTGRKEQFHTVRQSGGLSGFPKRSESIHDPFNTGHSSTSISAGLGLLTGMNMQKIPGKVIAVIGDGSMTGGIAFEAINHAGHMGKELIVVLNDNNMSINANVGALSLYLSRLTTTLFYQTFKRNFDNMVKKIPLIGGFLNESIARCKKGVKAVFFKDNLFSDLGFEYVGPIDGHNMGQLINVLESVKKISKPVVIHVSTVKGKGYEQAEGDPTFYHGVSPFSLVDGKVEKKSRITYTEAFSSSLIEYAGKDNRIVAITAAMAEGTGLKNFKLKYPDRFFDVGITEQHAVTFAAGLAASGMKPVVAIYSTFMQRAVDQVIHDTALQSLPVIFIVDRAGLIENDGETHQGIFDISLFRSIPNLELLSPYDQTDMDRMLEYALGSEKPVMIRFPKDIAPDPVGESHEVVTGKGRFLYKNTSEILLMGHGGILSSVSEAGFLLSRKGIENDIYNLCFLKPMDEDYLCELVSCYRKVYLFEDNSEINGTGEHIASLLYRKKIKTEFLYRGIGDYFPEHGSRKELIKNCRLDAQSIFDFIVEGENASGKNKASKKI